MKHIVDVTGIPVTTNYVWDVNRSVPEVLQDGTNTYVYGLGRISATDVSGVQTYYTSDGLGSTADLTNSAATKTDGYIYDVFGTPTHAPGSSANPFQFTGQQRDGDSGLQYLRARYYDPTTGRFLSPDPIPGVSAVPGTQNRYLYALNNPTYISDPLGLCGLCDLATSTVTDVAVAVAPYAAQCAIWGAGGFIAGNVAGAGIGCAAGAGALFTDDLFGRNPLSECVSWGAAGFVRGGYWGAGIGCATAVTSYYAPRSSELRCGIWLLGGFIDAKAVGAVGFRAIRGGLGGCFGGALSAAEPGVAYSNYPPPSLMTSPGKE